MPYLFYIKQKSTMQSFSPNEEKKMCNRRNKGDDAPQTPLPPRPGRYNPNTSVSYSNTQRKPLCSAVATSTTPLIHNDSLALSSSPVNDQRQLNTIVESRVSSAVASADVGGIKSPTFDTEIEAGLIVPELGKAYVVYPNKTCMTSLNMGFATLFLHATITKVADTTTGKERPWLMFSDIHTNPRDVKIDRIMKENIKNH
jgi:hypothetical protein